jgi:2-haloacid dehalogenase
MADSQITAVVFDLGGVLIDWNPRHLYRQLISDQDELDYFLSRICTPEWHLAHDRGVDTEQSCRELAQVHPEYADLIMAWAHRGEDMVAGVFDDTVDVLSELRSGGVRCLALSNMEPDTFIKRHRRFSFFGLLDGWVISGQEGVVKPDRAIFEILLSRYGLEPAATVFIDDNQVNVAAAAELGVVAIEFTTAAQLRKELRDLRLPVGLPEDPVGQAT